MPIPFKFYSLQKLKKLITFGCVGIARKTVSKEEVHFIFLSFRLTGKTHFKLLNQFRHYENAAPLIAINETDAPDGFEPS